MSGTKRVEVAKTTGVLNLALEPEGRHGRHWAGSTAAGVAMAGTNIF